ncbi:hypothetical protein FRB94_002936 [Tulasnella sp. JGI-2019a]|nr:hypothetical protein FRB93_013142 [Tulasnella sp. JGI-2019a]KAG9013408.1 hypothetical protein FRB94_002936 [Tulasnella sp. JGI-2019a]
MPPKRIRHRPAKKSTVAAYQPSDLIIKDTVDKGKGVFSSTPIPQGTCIISEYPIVTFPFIHTPKDIIASVLGCTEGERNKIMAFSYSAAFASLHPYQRIAETNCVPMPEREQAGLFETICRVNHDCRPNAMYLWEERLGKEVLRALTDIPAGEEITVSYTPNLLDRRERRELLQSAWDFSCRCLSCALPPDELAKSDQRVSQLSRIIDAHADTTFLRTSPTFALAKVRQALAIIKEEKLWHQDCDQYYDAFQVCAAWGDMVNAKVWAGRAVNAYTRNYGADGERTMQMRAHAEDPRGFSEWGTSGIRMLSS